MDNFLLTIAIPTYNGAKTIRNILELLLPQCTAEIEFMVVDNGSTDHTELIIADYQKRYPFIQYIRNEQNIGPDANFLKCLKIARGQFVWLLSDDDVVIEDSLVQVLSYLRRYGDVSLVYATTVDFRGTYQKLSSCQFHKPILKEDIYTQDKGLFMECAGAYWGFLSSFIVNKADFDKIVDPEQFFGTYWLQSYIHALCAAARDAKLGIVHSPCVGAGIYVNVPNFDPSMVNGVYYKRMLDYMSEYAGFPQPVLNKLFAKRFCHLTRHDIIKEKASGLKKTDRKQMYHFTKKYPSAWITVYPLLLIPAPVCRIALGIYRKMRGMTSEVQMNRPGDVAGAVIQEKE